MKIVNGQNAYQGIFVERKKEQQDALTFTEEQKTASVNRVKRAACDSFTVSEEAKSFIKGEKKEFIEYTRFYQDDKIAQSKEPFWKQTGSQYLVFSEKLYHSGFFDSMSDKKAREAEAILSTITKGMDSLSNAQYLTGKGPSGVSGKGYTLPNSYEARMELESSTAALQLFGEKFIEDEGLRKEFQGLVDDYYAHNMEVLEEYGNPVEKMAWAVKRFYNSSESTVHTKAEEQQYGEDLAEIFEKLRKNPSDKSVIWKQIQDTMLDYAANKEDGQEKRDQILSGAGDSFKRMEECWSFASITHTN